MNKNVRGRSYRTHVNERHRLVGMDWCCAVIDRTLLTLWSLFIIWH